MRRHWEGGVGEVMVMEPVSLWGGGGRGELAGSWVDVNGAWRWGVSKVASQRSNQYTIFAPNLL